MILLTEKDGVALPRLQGGVETEEKKCKKPRSGVLGVLEGVEGVEDFRRPRVRCPGFEESGQETP
jgi:hypothetical protein